MDFHKFISLKQEKQLTILAKEGVCLYKKKQKENTISLYQLEGYYVEVHYNHIDEKVIELRVSNSIDFIEPYLDKISVPQLLKKTLFIPFLETLDLMEPIIVCMGW